MANERPAHIKKLSFAGCDSFFVESDHANGWLPHFQQTLKDLYRIVALSVADADKGAKGQAIDDSWREYGLDLKCNWELWARILWSSLQEQVEKSYENFIAERKEKRLWIVSQKVSRILDCPIAQCVVA